MYAKIKKIYKFVSREKNLKFFLAVILILYLVISNKNSLLQLLLNETQKINYTKTEYVLFKCKDYLNDNKKFIKDEGSHYCITISELKENKYVSGIIRNPNTLELLPDSYMIEANYVNNDFEVKYNNYCK